MIRTFVTVGVLALLALPVRAQEETDAPPTPKERALAAISLPKSARALREQGVDKEEVRKALKEARGRKMNARQAKELLDESKKAVEENGPIDNFGAFVQKKLDEGLRGRDLAAAIRAEHAARGKGRGKGRGGDKAGAGEDGNHREDAGGREDRGNRGGADDSDEGEGEDDAGKPEKPERPEKPEKPEKPERGNPGKGGGR